MSSSRCLLLFCGLLAYPLSIYSHGFISKPTCKQGGTQETPQSVTKDKYFDIASWWLDRAHFNGDPRDTPWNQPGKFNYLDAETLEVQPQVFHPCGCQATNIIRCAGVADNAPNFGELTEDRTTVPPKWALGSKVETTFNLHANHMGGYIYMLCSYAVTDKCAVDFPPTTKQNDYLKCMWECFQSNVLEFEIGSQALQYRTDKDMLVILNAKNKSSGTFPPNSVWRQIPIGDNNQGDSAWNYVNRFTSDTVKTHFTTDFGDNSIPNRAGPAGHSPYNWHILDKLKIPTNLPSGPYMLSWRYDCGVANQIWTNCADVEIVGESNPDTTNPDTTNPDTTNPGTTTGSEETTGSGGSTSTGVYALEDSAASGLNYVSALVAVSLISLIVVV